MQYQVPQFIEVESKIIGPLTLKQFLYLGVGGLLSFLLFWTLETWLWLIVTAIIGISAAALAFIKINGRPLPLLLKSAVIFVWQPKMYLWKREEPAAGLTELRVPEIPAATEEKTGIKGLWVKMLTSLSPISKREKASPTALNQIKRQQ